MPKGTKFAPLMQAPPNFMDHHDERLQRWKDVVRSDPRRAVRALTIRGFAESIDGDTAMDSPYILQELRDITKDSTAYKTWANLVNAGVVEALCKCTLNFQAALMQNPKTPKASAAEMKETSQQMRSPYHYPLEVICLRMELAPRPPTSTEKRIVEDMRLYWNAVLERIWSEPSHSLRPELKAVVERLVVAQTLWQLTAIDPSFLEMVTKPGNMTLAVLMRNWLHATVKDDSRMNAVVLVAFLGGTLPSYCKKYVDEHPLPAPPTVLARILIGASKGTDDSKKKVKRTPALQAAETIISTFARRFKQVELSNEPEFELFQKMFRVCREEPHRPFVRALLKSADIWSAMATSLSRAGDVPASAKRLTFGVLSTYLSAITCMEQEGPEFREVAFANWISGGFFEALEAASSADLLNWPPASMVLTNILAAMLKYQPRLSTTTCNALRAELPRSRIVKRLILVSSFAPGDPEGPGEARSQKIRRGQLEILVGRIPEADNPIWAQCAWQTLASLAFAVEDPGACSRRGCDRRAAEPRPSSTYAAMCKSTSYCSKACLERDKEEHMHVCGWMHVIEAQHAQDEGDPTPNASAATEPLTGGMSMLRLE
ncbi:hypothetical protein C2E23DRAFT_776471 [Lenzites betulinus]|nr:hypothetical protein C2E23DRAFT_776471 [Lenzites betulinus]